MNLQACFRHPEDVDAAIFDRLPTAMEALIAPSRNAGIAAEVPRWIASIGMKYPQGDRHLLGCLEAGLWILADDLERAHVICQDISTSYGSAWHAVVHRREPDFSNSRYWWRRAGSIAWKDGKNPPLAEIAGKYLDGANVPALAVWRKDLARGYDPAGFVELVETQHTSADPAVLAALANLQRLEWGALFLECFDRFSAG